MPSFNARPSSTRRLSNLSSPVCSQTKVSPSWRRIALRGSRKPFSADPAAVTKAFNKVPGATPFEGDSARKALVWVCGSALGAGPRTSASNEASSPVMAVRRTVFGISAVVSPGRRSIRTSAAFCFSNEAAKAGRSLRSTKAGPQAAMSRACAEASSTRSRFMAASAVSNIRAEALSPCERRSCTRSNSLAEASRATCAPSMSPKDTAMAEASSARPKALSSGFVSTALGWAVTRPAVVCCSLVQCSAPSCFAPASFFSGSPCCAAPPWGRTASHVTAAPKAMPSTVPSTSFFMGSGNGPSGAGCSRPTGDS